MEIELESQKKHLEDLLYELKNVSEPNVRRYFHVNTVENLITHFQEIKTANDRNWVYISLLDYFKKCFEFVPSIDRQKSKDLFDEYIDKITDYYSNLGFVALSNRTIVYFIYILTVSLCFIFFSWHIVASVVFLILIQIIWMYKKNKNKKVYGLFW